MQCVPLTAQQSVDLTTVVAVELSGLLVTHRFTAMVGLYMYLHITQIERLWKEQCAFYIYTWIVKFSVSN